MATGRYITLCCSYNRASSYSNQSNRCFKIWHDLVEDYPSPELILEVPDDILFNKVKILGFGNIKVKALKLASGYIIEHYKGRVPDNLNSLLKIPYVGDYVARAVLCFAFNKRIEIVDTNVLRFFHATLDCNLTVMPEESPILGNCKRNTSEGNKIS